MTTLNAHDGPASLVTTYWLDETTTIPGLPGRWTTSDGTVSLVLDAGATAKVRDTSVTGTIVALSQNASGGPRVRFATATVQAVRRSGRVGIRFFDHARAGSTDVDAFEFMPSWVIEATFRPDTEATRRSFNFAGETPRSLANRWRAHLHPRRTRTRSAAAPGGRRGTPGLRRRHDRRRNAASRAVPAHPAPGRP